MVRLRRRGGQGRAHGRRASTSARPTSCTSAPAVRGYLPDPPVIATEIQAQLKKNLGINVELDQQDDTTYLDNAADGLLDGIQMLGWGADYPDQTNFVGYHFGAGASKQFGDKYPDLVAALDEGAKGTSDAAREPAYTKANELIKQHVPMIPIAHGGSAVAFRADVTGAHSSPLTNEQFSVMKAGDRAAARVQPERRAAAACTAPTRPMARPSGPAIRRWKASTATRSAAPPPIPVLADKCEANADFTQWTCTLKSGVTFHDGSSFDADDVVTSFAVQWDADQSAPQGPDGRLHLLLEPVRWVPQPARFRTGSRPVIQTARGTTCRGRSFANRRPSGARPRGVVTA